MSDVLEGVIKKITTWNVLLDVQLQSWWTCYYSDKVTKSPINPKTLYKEGDKVLVKVTKYDNEKHPPFFIYKAYLESSGWDRE